MFSFSLLMVTILFPFTGAFMVLYGVAID